LNPLRGIQASSATARLAMTGGKIASLSWKWHNLLAMKNIIIIGAGLAGSEAAWQAAEAGASVRLYEMRPKVKTEAHKTDGLAELVCSNSFRGADLTNAVGLLKEEMRRLNSLIMLSGKEARVPAGGAFAVDREIFSSVVTKTLSDHPNIEIVREEVTEIPEEGVVVIATGPLTSAKLSDEIKKLTGSESLFFYDAIAPIVHADSIDMSKCFKGARYSKGTTPLLSLSPAYILVNGS